MQADRGYPMNTRAKGFTLIEMLVVVAIVAILAAIAYPAYQNYIRRARRADGKELAMRIAAAEERYFTNRNRYSTNLADDIHVNSTSEKGYYSAVVTLDHDEQTYLITLSPQDAQQDDECGDLRINNTGFKDQSGSADANGKCW
jgi:type IV pilus assembly protein PilE